MDGGFLAQRTLQARKSILLHPFQQHSFELQSYREKQTLMSSNMRFPIQPRSRIDDEQWMSSLSDHEEASFIDFPFPFSFDSSFQSVDSGYSLPQDSTTTSIEWNGGLSTTNLNNATTTTLKPAEAIPGIFGYDPFYNGQSFSSGLQNLPPTSVPMGMYREYFTKFGNFSDIPLSVSPSPIADRHKPENIRTCPNFSIMQPHLLPDMTLPSPPADSWIASRDFNGFIIPSAMIPEADRPVHWVSTWCDSPEAVNPEQLTWSPVKTDISFSTSSSPVDSIESTNSFVRETLMSSISPHSSASSGFERITEISAQSDDHNSLPLMRRHPLPTSPLSQPRCSARLGLGVKKVRFNYSPDVKSEPDSDPVDENENDGPQGDNQLFVRKVENEEQKAPDYASDNRKRSKNEKPPRKRKTALQPAAMERKRSSKDVILMNGRAEGLTYKEIKRKGNFKEAESTLRGRYRALVKAKEARVRRPEWKKIDIDLLYQGVQKFNRTDQTRGGKDLA